MDRIFNDEFEKDVGMLTEEPVQKLLIIFTKQAEECLKHIESMSMIHGEERFDRLFKVGLDIVARWDDDVLKEELSRLRECYPDADSLHAFCMVYLRDMQETQLANRSRQMSGATLDKTYGYFMKLVASHSDVARGKKFLAAPSYQKKIFYTDLFRLTYHTLIQCFPQAPSSEHQSSVIVPDQQNQPETDIDRKTIYSEESAKTANMDRKTLCSEEFVKMANMDKKTICSEKSARMASVDTRPCFFSNESTATTIMEK